MSITGDEVNYVEIENLRFRLNALEVRVAALESPGEALWCSKHQRHKMRISALYVAPAVYRCIECEPFTQDDFGKEKA